MPRIIIKNLLICAMHCAGATKYLITITRSKCKTAQ